MTPSSALTPPSPSARLERRPASLIVTGNPNVGKSVLFHALTGRYAAVSNYPGTTVMVSEGRTSLDGVAARIYDTPGLNSLAASSEDEVVARELLLRRQAAVLQVGDAKNLLRAVLLALELAEAEIPSVLVLNMMDEARERDIAIDADRLSALLGVPVVETIATQRWGLDRLRRAIPQARAARRRVSYPSVIEEAAAEAARILPQDCRAGRALALLWLAGDPAVIAQLTDQEPAEALAALTRIRAKAQERTAVSLSRLISDARLQEARRLVTQVMTTAVRTRRPWLERAGDLAMHPVWGVPVLLATLAAMYVLVGDLAAQRGVDFFEEVIFGRYLIPAIRWVVEGLVPWAWLQALFVGPYGLLTMALPYAFAIILPIVGMFFLCFGFIEDVGYLPRLAVVANRFCRLLGLNGKAVLPLVLGLGCGTMATMTTRILESRRDRVLVTLLLALGIPCSAQLGVILAMLAGRPPLAAAVWLGVVAAVVVVVGQAAARVLPGEESPFLYELPPLRRPKLSNILLKTLGRLEWYVKEAVPLFFLGTLVLFVLHTTGLLAVLERAASPLVVSWLGLPVEATAALLVGFLRRDFGAAGFFALQRQGRLSGVQTVTALVTITLLIPCIAQYFMMVKERGWRTANLTAAFVIGVALTVGGLVFRALTSLGLAV
ncbi:MAG: ferrous iron transport protein B [Candidatus Omnitrophica bacterium]|nr:ferrous iron transport protein B [Candidatus Omnitrophota bacterium]